MLHHKHHTKSFVGKTKSDHENQYSVNYYHTVLLKQKSMWKQGHYIKQSLELRKWGSHWSMYNFNYEYMTFLYVVHVYMFCNVVLHCIALPARVLFAIKIIIIFKIAHFLGQKLLIILYSIYCTSNSMSFFHH